MARIKFGAIVTDMRGKLGGHVFQKGNQSRVMKTNQNPRKTITAANMATGSFVNAARTRWLAFGENSKERWSNTARNFQYSSTFGDKITYNGFQFYMKLNTLLLRAGFPVLDSPVGLNPVSAPPLVASWVMNISAQTFESSISGSYSGRRAVVECSWSKSYRQSPAASTFHYLKNLYTFSGDGPGNFAAFLINFGAPAITDTLFVRYCLVNSSGFRSEWFVSQVTIV